MKITRKALITFGLIITVFSILFFSCKKNAVTTNKSSQPRNVAVYLTDAPCQYDSVFIDIKYIELKIDTSVQGRNGNHEDNNNNNQGNDNQGNDNSGNDEEEHHQDHEHSDKNGIWDTLNIKPGLYNILQLRNGNDVIFGTGTIPAGTIREMRFTLGTNSYVVVSGVKHTLIQFRDEDSFSYIKVHGVDEDEDFKPGQTSMWLDFNICKSIRSDDGNYFLKPFISIYSMNQTGRLEGTVLPNAAQPYVTAWNATDTASALPEEDGGYKIRGLKAGTYNVIFQGTFGYKDTTILNIVVKNNQDTKLPTITLHQ